MRTDQELRSDFDCAAAADVANAELRSDSRSDVSANLKAQDFGSRGPKSRPPIYEQIIYPELNSLGCVPCRNGSVGHTDSSAGFGTPAAADPSETAEDFWKLFRPILRWTFERDCTSPAANSLFPYSSPDLLKLRTHIETADRFSCIE